MNELGQLTGRITLSPCIGPVVTTALNLAAPRFGICGITLKVARRLLQTSDRKPRGFPVNEEKIMSIAALHSRVEDPFVLYH